jgi:hypothetical protein
MSIGYHWKEVANRRNFFFVLAKDKGFDPLVSHNWYNLAPESIASATVCLENSKTFLSVTHLQGASSVLAYYNNNYAQALVQLFPEIGLDENKFSSATQMISGSRLMAVAHRKKFEQLSRTQGFDPLVAANWYSLRKDVVASMKVKWDLQSI